MLKLTFEEIKELIDQVASHRLSGVEIKSADFRLKIDGHRSAKAETASVTRPPVVAAAVETVVPSATVAPTVEAVAAEPKPVDSLPKGAQVLKSQLIGTFYRAPKPEAPPFVKEGDHVQEGQVLCIVEAMKLMNEIEAEAAGTIVEVYAENSQAVEYGTPLFAFKADG